MIVKLAAGPSPKTLVVYVVREKLLIDRQDDKETSNMCLHMPPIQESDESRMITDLQFLPVMES